MFFSQCVFCRVTILGVMRICKACVILRIAKNRFENMCSPTGITVGVHNNRTLPNFRLGTWHFSYAAFCGKKLSKHVLLCKLRSNDCSFRFYYYLFYFGYILVLLNFMLISFSVQRTYTRIFILRVQM